jgi:hypothetical protein
MLNLNDSIYDYKDYSIYGDRNHPEFIVSDKDSLSRLITYASFEKQLIDNILNKKLALYLRFCDGEYLYYRKWFHFMPWLQKILWRDTTCRWEKPDIKMVPKHFEIFEKHKDHIYFCPHVSDSRIKQYAWSKLCDYIKKKNLSIYHFYYVYHFLNKIRQNKIEILNNIKIWYITHNKYIASLDHFPITVSYSQESITYLRQQDFSHYDLLLLWWGTASPLYADAIATTAQCPIIDAGYMLSIWESNTLVNDRGFSNIML